ncbi:MAG: (Fe-S)-binding protein [Deltaproteobacteria bacterium]|nr:(Fe-S)-binding protein [Deltaproteobacteria bacterium]
MALEDYRADALRCTRCAYCKWIPFDLIKSWRFSKGCPSVEYNHFHSYSAGGRLVTALSLMDGRSTVTEAVKESVFKCQMCGNCDVTCKMCRYDMWPIEALHELRFRLVDQGHGLAQHQPVMKGFRSLSNMLNKPKSKRGDWAEGLDLKRLSKHKSKLLFHAGCQYSHDPDLREAVRNAAELLKKAGVDFAILGADESCCGGRAYHMGYKADYQAAAERNLKIWADAGVETVVTPCADCYHTFKRLYPESGSSVAVIHMVELIDRLLKQGKISFTKALPMRVTYHDPCYLGRQGEPYVAWKGKEKKIFGQAVVYDPPRPRYNGAKGVYQPPRDVLMAIPGLELVEMERNREAAWCCGAGGGVREAYPEYSMWTASERLEEAKSVGADALASACPWCEKNFADAATRNGTKIKIVDIIELVYQAL